MIKVTNNTADFFENQKGQIFIYGAGNSGYWIGNYMNRCGISFLAYIDRNVAYNGALCNEKPVFLPEKLKEYNEHSIRLIISPHLYESVLCDLMFKEREYGLNILCLIPRYMNYILCSEIYDINYLLAYFRRKLFVGDTPTIISNDCVAGEIYHAMDMIMLSPTINTVISPEDFVKLCFNSRKYFDMEGNKLFFNILPIGPETGEEKRAMPAIKLDDITVTFAHTLQTVELIERWNTMRKLINWNNIIYILRCNHISISMKVINEFSKLKEKHLLLNYGGNGRIFQEVDQMFLFTNVFDPNRAIENEFDLLGWMNEGAKNKNAGK